MSDGGRRGGFPGGARQEIDDVARARQVLADAKGVLAPALRAAIDRLDTGNRAVVAYHLGFTEADGSPGAGGGNGKRVRGALALLSARAAGAGADRGVPAAVACELVHDFSLLHDDLMDGDRTRRHRPTAWTVFGQPAAILAGDAMIALAFELIADPGGAVDDGSAVRAVRLLGSAARELAAGQAADMSFESRDDVGVDEAQAMVSAKTGALLACAAGLGAVLAGAEDALVAELQRFGRHLGMAFQFVDDLLGIYGQAEETGKSVASDLASRKKSLPVVAALAAGGPAAERLRAVYASEHELSAAEIAAAAEAVAAAGGRDWARAQADAETAAALEVLARVDLAPPVRGELTALTNMLCRRRS